ncbi:Nif3-like dinuclear metal center hexameric protein [Clostridium sp. MD294]|uniref:Nif3-like dinuclear metal center hexameric protein n=1 Tax=Clostridium sp. MD294 TaxID=97138 RepID=UPI0002C8E367|nr:Nif3-like dinuclear metal center hexameric protein [Clostridium sp. MD294]NDO46565.1 Nif3-like dinuclear metal center hexameric protein [Clostridium sp. MD294]USF29004.1 GTP cyclohydrolase 1 type 2 [Clostridium sp. MD294]
MAVLCKEIIEQIETFAPQYLAEQWDNVGLTVGDKNKEVKKVLVALDVMTPVIEEAIHIGADLIVTHHPMILFQKIKNIQSDTSLGKKIYNLIKNDISAYCAHTNLDIAFGGTNDVLANLAGLENIKILKNTNAEQLKKIVVYVPKEHQQTLREAICDAGAGFIGNYSHCTFSSEGIGTFLPLEGTKPYLGKPGLLEKVQEVRLETIVPSSLLHTVLKTIKKVHPYEEPAYDIYDVEQKGKQYGIGRIGTLKESMTFEQYSVFLKKQLSLDSIRIVGEKNKNIKTVALCTGSGVEFMEQAKIMGADAYLTGDIKFHEAQRAIEMGLCVADVTHYASEVIVVPILKQFLEQKSKQYHWDIEVIQSSVNGQVFEHIS